MSRRKREIFQLPTTTPGTYLVGAIRYEEGGMSYFSGQSNRRGYYFSVTPEEIERCADGTTLRKFRMFSGIKRLLLEVKRFNERTFEGLTVCDEMRMNLIEHVCQKENYTLKTEGDANVDAHQVQGQSQGQDTGQPAQVQ